MYDFFLRDIRKFRKLTMKQLGEMVGVCEATIGLYETKKRNPDCETLLRLANVLNCTVNDFFYKECYTDFLGYFKGEED